MEHKEKITREESIHAEVLHVSSEPFVEPQALPPLHGDQVAEPLVRQLVRHDDRHALLLLGRGSLRV